MTKTPVFSYVVAGHDGGRVTVRVFYANDQQREIDSTMPMCNCRRHRRIMAVLQASGFAAHRYTHIPRALRGMVIKRPCHILRSS
jgi:hypothetical protein